MFDSLVTNLTTDCCVSVSSITKSPYLQGRAHPTVCGFTTQISALLFLSIDHTIKNHPDWVQTLRDDNLKMIIEECKKYINRRERLFVAFQAELCNYAQRKDGSVHENTPSTLCRSAVRFDQTTIMVGVPYIYTLFDTHHTTQHHFCVFRADHGDNCILADSWAGSGRRTNWTRIMNIQEFLDCMKIIHNTTIVSVQSSLINIMFHVPYVQTSEYSSQKHVYRVLVYAITPDVVNRIENNQIDLLGGGGPKRR
jgi:hypothetical protein